MARRAEPLQPAKLPPQAERVAAFKRGLSAESRAALLLIARLTASWSGGGKHRSARSTSSPGGVAWWCSSKSKPAAAWTRRWKR
jgi:hypothetical protein